MQTQQFGEQLRGWRRMRRMSQLDLALEAEISSRHLSFVETGRSRPSREMVLRLAETLDVPLRGRNALLVAAGLAPHFPERSLDDPALAPARRAIDMILKGHEPFPALAVDRRWNLVAHNAAVAPFLAGVSPDLLVPPVNVLRLSLHPEGLAPRIVNLAEWKAHLVQRLRDQHAASADRRAARGCAPSSRPIPPTGPGRRRRIMAASLVPMVLDAGDGRRLSFLSTTTVFGTPVEVTLSEIAIEAFFPADEETAQRSALRQQIAGHARAAQGGPDRAPQHAGNRIPGLLDGQRRHHDDGFGHVLGIGLEVSEEEFVQMSSCLSEPLIREVAMLSACFASSLPWLSTKLLIVEKPPPSSPFNAATMSVSICSWLIALPLPLQRILDGERQHRHVVTVSKRLDDIRCEAAGTVVRIPHSAKQRQCRLQTCRRCVQATGGIALRVAIVAHDAEFGKALGERRDLSVQRALTERVERADQFGITLFIRAIFRLG